jgi:hypothetical protein
MDHGYTKEVVCRILGVDELMLEELERAGRLLGLAGEGERYYHHEDVARLAGDRDLSGHAVQDDLEHVLRSRPEQEKLGFREHGFDKFEGWLQEALGPGGELWLAWPTVPAETTQDQMYHAVGAVADAFREVADIEGNPEKLQAVARSVRVRHLEDPKEQGLVLGDGVIEAGVCLSLEEDDLLGEGFWMIALGRAVPGLEVYEDRPDVIEDDLPDVAEELEKCCGKEIAVEVDWPSFTCGDDLDEDNKAIRDLESNGFSPVVSALEDALEDDEEKRALVRSRLDAVRLVRVRGDEPESLAMEGSTLVIRARIRDEDGDVDFGKAGEVMATITG